MMLRCTRHPGGGGELEQRRGEESGEGSWEKTGRGGLEERIGEREKKEV